MRSYIIIILFAVTVVGGAYVLYLWISPEKKWDITNHATTGMHLTKNNDTEVLLENKSFNDKKITVSKVVNKKDSNNTDIVTLQVNGKVIDNYIAPWIKPNQIKDTFVFKGNKGDYLIVVLDVFTNINNDLIKYEQWDRDIKIYDKNMKNIADDLFVKLYNQNNDEIPSLWDNKTLSNKDLLMRELLKLKEQNIL